MTVSEILEAAADLIEQYGWVQHGPGDKSRGFDLLESLKQAASPGERDHFPAYQALVDHLKGRSLVSYNDEPGRTKDEVVAALRGAAKASDGTGGENE